MTVKLIGGCLIIVTSYLFGIKKYQETKSQLNMLRQFKNDVIFLKNGIELSKKPICDMICDFTNNASELNELYVNFNKLCNKNDISDAWKQSVKLLDLNEKYKKVFFQFADLFSLMDINGQKEMFENYIKTLEIEINEADDYIKKNGKLFKNLGLYAGILVTVLLA